MHAHSYMTLCDSWTATGQAPLSMRFSKQECWSGLPSPPPDNLPDPEIEPMFLTFLYWQEDLYHHHHLGSPYMCVYIHMCVCVCVCVYVNESASLSVLFNSVTPWTGAHQAPLSMGFFRQEHWSGLPFPSSGDLPNSGIKPGSPALQADSSLSGPPRKPMYIWTCHFLSIQL